jgi:actin-related protein
MVGIGSKDVYVGDEAEAHRGIFKVSHPIEHGVVRNWDDMEKLLHHTFYNELRVAPEEHATLFSVPVMSPLAQQEKMAQILFESFAVPACAGVLAPALSLYASGRGTGVVVEIGAGVMQIVPIYESKIIDEAIIRRDFGGDDLTRYMATMLTERSAGTASLSSALVEDVDKLKQQCCYVANDFEAELFEFACSSSKDMVYVFSDGTQHKLGAERIRTGEAFFKPALVGVEMQGLHKMVYESVLRCPMDTRRDFYANIIVSGGPTLMNGFPERLQKELTALAPSTMRCKVVAPPERKYSTWIGGSIIGSLSTFQQKWMSKEEYDEEGPLGIHKRGCLQTTLDRRS